MKISRWRSVHTQYNLLISHRFYLYSTYFYFFTIPSQIKAYVTYVFPKIRGIQVVPGVKVTTSGFNSRADSE